MSSAVLKQIRGHCPQQNTETEQLTMRAVEAHDVLQMYANVQVLKESADDILVLDRVELPF